MRWSERRDRLRAAVGGSRCICPASVFNPLSMRMAEDLGYELAMLAGSVASLEVLGAPDIAVLTLTELVGLVLRLNRAATLPLLVDADHGYGNAINVQRTVEELEIAGAAALTIEDTELPAAFGHASKTRLLSLEEGAGKMRAAVAARQDPRLLVIGRTGAMRSDGLEETLRRVRAYAATGVDGLFLVGIQTRAELDAVAEAIQLPIWLGGSPSELSDGDYLASRGVRVALQGHLPHQAMMQAAYRTLEALRQGTPPGEIPDVAPADLARRLSREEEYLRAQREYLVFCPINS